MSDYIDLERIQELQDAMGSDATAIMSSLLRSMSDAIERVERAVGAGELDDATRAAHLCRNDALMLGARQLQQALSDLEAATRDWDAPRAGAALERVRAAWPLTRDELERAIS